MGKTPHKMTDMAVIVSQRVAHQLRREWPYNTAKLSAREFKASPRTTERWLNGQLPSNKHMLQMVRRWGKRFVAYIYEPVLGDDLKAYALGEEIRQVQRNIARLEREINAANFDGVGGSTAGAAQGKSQEAEYQD